MIPVIISMIIITDMVIRKTIEIWKHEQSVGCV